MRLQSRTWLGAVLATGFFTVAAQAQFLETFESCATGPITTGPPNALCNNWQQWDSAPNVTSLINTDVARNGTKSVSVDAILAGQTSDLVHTYSGFTSGQWTFRAWSYLPGPGATLPLVPAFDKIYFLILNTYNDFGPYDWSVQLTMDPAAGTWQVDAGSAATATGAIFVDRWVECRAEIDLNANLCEVFYDGVSTAPAYSWTGGVFGGGFGALNIACIDLYHGPATVVGSGKGYWDDVALQLGPQPAPPITYCAGKVNVGLGGSPGGCTPSISSSGPLYSSATQTSGFNVFATGVLTGKSTLLFYTTNVPPANGQASTPFQLGTLCVKVPIRRTQNVTATPATGPCVLGVTSIDFNAFAHQVGPPVPPVALQTPGITVNCQWWGRDQGIPPPNNTQLSNGLQFDIGP